jgi:hypothetical protein
MDVSAHPVGGGKRECFLVKVGVGIINLPIIDVSQATLIAHERSRKSLHSKAQYFPSTMPISSTLNS